MLGKGIVIQSRMSSSRLPAKAGLSMPSGRCCIQEVVHRMEQYLTDRSIQIPIIVACPSEDFSIYEKLIENTSAILFGGDRDNVASRFLGACVENKLEKVLSVVKITNNNTKTETATSFEIDLIDGFDDENGTELRKYQLRRDKIDVK